MSFPFSIGQESGGYDNVNRVLALQFVVANALRPLVRAVVEYPVWEDIPHKLILADISVETLARLSVSIEGPSRLARTLALVRRGGLVPVLQGSRAVGKMTAMLHQ